MKSSLRILCLFLLASAAASAELKSLQITVHGMDSETRAQRVLVLLKAVSGVDSVSVNVAKRMATVTMKPRNRVTIKQVQKAIAKSGFTMEQTEVVLIGTVAQTNARQALIKVSGTSDVFEVAPLDALEGMPAMVGQAMEIAGTLQDTPKGKAPGTLRVRSIVPTK